MMTLPELAADALGSFLASDIKDRFGSSHARLAELIPFGARLALECIGSSDASIITSSIRCWSLWLAITSLRVVRYDAFDTGRLCAFHRRLPDPDYIGYVRGIFKGDGDDCTNSIDEEGSLLRSSLFEKSRCALLRVSCVFRGHSFGPPCARRCLAAATT